MVLLPLVIILNGIGLSSSWASVCNFEGRDVGHHTVSWCECGTNLYRLHDASNPCSKKHALAQSRKMEMSNDTLELASKSGSALRNPSTRIAEGALLLQTIRSPLLLSNPNIDLSRYLEDHRAAVQGAVIPEPNGEDEKEELTKVPDSHGLPGRPIFTNQQIEEIFGEHQRVEFEVVWDKGSSAEWSRDSQARLRAHGSERTALYQELASRRLFALAFEGLYSINRKALDQAAEKTLASNEKFVVRFFFQRKPGAMDYFGYAGNFEKSSSSTEKKFRKAHLAEDPGSNCPAIVVTIRKVQLDGTETVKEVYPYSLRLYGGKDDAPLVTSEELIRSMQSF